MFTPHLRIGRDVVEGKKGNIKKEPILSIE